MFFRDTNSAKLLTDLNLSFKDISPLENENWLLLFSGGPDSVFALFCLIQFHRWFDKPRQLHLLYLNHYADEPDRLNRPAEKKREELLEAYQAIIGREKKIQLFFHRFNKPVAEIARRSGDSFEYCGSKLRHKALLKISRQFSLRAIFTGHQLNDWYETLIMRLNRGTSPEKIMPFDFCHRLGFLYFFRPLFLCPADIVRQQCTEMQLEYYTDPENTNPAILRNQIRRTMPPFNINGLILSARNFLYKQRIENSYQSELRDLLENNLQIIEENFEYYLPFDIYADLPASGKIATLKYFLARLGIFSLRYHQFDPLLKPPGRYKNIFIDLENWNNRYFVVFRRGRSHRLPSVVKSYRTPDMLYGQDPNHITADTITKSLKIQLKFGRKSVLKLLKEKKISRRQRQWVKLYFNPQNHSILRIDLSNLGLSDVDADLTVLE